MIYILKNQIEREINLIDREKCCLEKKSLFFMIYFVLIIDRVNLCWRV